MTGFNESVASKELRGLVDEFKRNGLPKPIPLKDAISTLNDEQEKILCEIDELGKKEEKVAQEGAQPIPESEWWRIREEARDVFQKAVLAGLIHLAFIQRHVVLYGAIPDPKERWRYYAAPDGSYKCWICGNDIMAKSQTLSVREPNFGLAGSGSVKHREVPFCSNCEPEPSDRGITYEEDDPYEEIKKIKHILV